MPLLHFGVEEVAQEVAVTPALCRLLRRLIQLCQRRTQSQLFQRLGRLLFVGLAYPATSS